MYPPIPGLMVMIFNHPFPVDCALLARNTHKTSSGETALGAHRSSSSGGVCVCIYTGFYMPACYFLINRRSESHPSYSLRFLHRYPYPFHFFLFFILLLIYTCSFFLLYNIYYIRRKCYADALVLFPFCLPFLLVVVITVP